MNPLHYSHHEGISCDHCMKSNFRGKRYKCLVCPDYDLCSSCYESGTVPAGKRHTSKHPVQCILTRNDYEIYFGGETTPVETSQSFTCPICGKMGFTESLLYDHAVQEHSDTFTEVSCPICCSMQNVEPGLTIEDFTSHLSIEHRSGRGYETPQASLRGRRVPHTNRGVNQARNRRQITPNTVTMLSNINPLLGSLPHDQAVGGLTGASSSQMSQIRDLDPITELLSQLRRSQNASVLSSNSFSSASPNPLHLHLDHRSFRGNTLRQVFERPSASDIVVRRHNQAALGQQANQSSLSAAHAGSLSYLLMDSSANQLTGGQPVPNSNSLTNQGQPPSNQFQFLLSTCKEKPKISKELEDAQRVDKSLFIQELLISSIENFLKHDLKFPKGSDQRISFDQSGLDDVRPEGTESKAKATDENSAKTTDENSAKATDQNKAKATDENKAADENKAKASNETKADKSEPQINTNESAASPNNHLPTGSDGPISSSTNQSTESAKVTNGVEGASTSQQTTESSHQSTNASSNNQELNHQIAKTEHSRAGEMAASSNSNEPVASNSVDHSTSNNVGNNVENASGTAGNPSSNALDTAGRIKPAPSNESVEQPRGEQPPAK